MPGDERQSRASSHCVRPRTRRRAHCDTESAHWHGNGRGAERSKATNADPWVIGLRRRRPSLVVAVALANKTARIAWAVKHRQENYQRMATAA